MVAARNRKGAPREKTEIRLLVVMSFFPEDNIVFDTIAEACSHASEILRLPITCFRVTDLVKIGEIWGKQLTRGLDSADLIVADLTRARPTVLWELGYAQAREKPVIVLTASDEPSVPFALRNFNQLAYERATGLKSLRPRLTDTIVAMISTQIVGARKPVRTAKHERKQIFVSYSHADAACLGRLLVHLRPLEKVGLVDLWSDRKLRPGDNWKAEIKTALSRAKVALLLVSADFLASDFIVENELPPLLAAAEAEGVRIIPLILKPCRFLRDKNLARFQAVNDPVFPLLKLPEIEQEEIYARLAELIEKD